MFTAALVAAKPAGFKLKGQVLAATPIRLDATRMYNQPYLETCCRSALHRLSLAGAIGRPAGLKDGPCLARLEEESFAKAGDDGRFVLTASGRARHAAEILRETAT